MTNDKSYDDLWDQMYPELRPKEPATTPDPEPLPDPSMLPAEFAKATMLAVRRVQTILAEDIPDYDENFGTKYRAQAAVASAQTGHQLKADDLKLKGQALENNNYYNELRAALDDFRAKRALEAAQTARAIEDKREVTR